MRVRNSWNSNSLIIKIWRKGEKVGINLEGFKNIKKKLNAKGNYLFRSEKY